MFYTCKSAAYVRFTVHLRQLLCSSVTDASTLVIVSSGDLFFLLVSGGVLVDSATRPSGEDHFLSRNGFPAEIQNTESFPFYESNDEVPHGDFVSGPW